MPFISRLYAFLIIGTLLTCCSARDARYSPKSIVIASDVLPPDVVKPSSGIFAVPGSADPADMCCWIGMDAVLRVRQMVRRPRSLTLGFYVPDGSSTNSAVHLQVQLDDGRFTQSFLITTSGYHVEHIHLPLRLVSPSRVRVVRIITVGSRPTTSQYSVLLSSLYFE